MLRKLAVALIAATVFTAPVFAQGTAPANPKADAAPATNAPATATPKIAAKPSLKHAKHHKRLAHHVKRVKHATHHKLHKDTYMRAGAATHPAAVKSHKQVKHTVKTHHAKHVRLARKSTTHARSDAPAALKKSVN